MICLVVSQENNTFVTCESTVVNGKIMFGADNIG